MKAAAERWARNPEAADALKRNWERLKECHKRYDYRSWLDGDAERGGGAKRVGDATRFTVGGHSFGHVHVEWTRSDDGWRISQVRLCR